jgi:CheY-like chemotaxis protein
VSKVLVVEDDPSLRAILRLLFEEAGYEVVEAGHGQAALDLLRDDDLPDVVTTDLMMPVMGGNELIHRLRTEPRTALIPILVISANAGAAEGLRAAEGADAVLGKPFVSTNLVKLVQYLNGAAPPASVAKVKR